MGKSKLNNSVADQFLDPQILDLLKKREEGFLGALFTEVNPYLYRVCFASGVYEIDAEEVIFDTWDRFFTNLEKFEGRSQIRTFLCGILFNKIREHRRKIGRIQLEEASEKIFESAFTLDGWWKTEPGDPHKILELKNAGALIQDCMDGLSEQQKAAFVMKEVEEEEANSVCEVLGINVSHLRVLIFRAKDKLRKCLEGKESLESV